MSWKKSHGKDRSDKPPSHRRRVPEAGPARRAAAVVAPGVEVPGVDGPRAALLRRAGAAARVPAAVAAAVPVAMA